VQITLRKAHTDAVRPPSEGRPRPCRPQVLVIDDEPALLRSLKLMLDGVYDVVVCNRSTEALELVRSDPARFDAMLCDLTMPELDGIAFYRHLEVLGLASRFVLMTGGAFTPHGEQFLHRESCRRINKPFTFEQLVAVLSAALPIAG